MKRPEMEEFDDLCAAKVIESIRRDELEEALKKAAKDERIADDMRDYWMCKADS